MAFLLAANSIWKVFSDKGNCVRRLNWPGRQSQMNVLEVKTYIEIETFGFNDQNNNLPNYQSFLSSRTNFPVCKLVFFLAKWPNACVLGVLPRKRWPLTESVSEHANGQSKL